MCFFPIISKASLPERGTMTWATKQYKIIASNEEVSWDDLRELRDIIDGKLHEALGEGKRFTIDDFERVMYEAMDKMGGKDV